MHTPSYVLGRFIFLGALYKVYMPDCGGPSGRPLCSPCERQSLRRGWAVPARPQRHHGPGVWLAFHQAAPGDESHV